MPRQLTRGELGLLAAVGAGRPAAAGRERANRLLSWAVRAGLIVWEDHQWKLTPLGRQALASRRA